MAAVEQLVTDHLDLWTAAVKRKSAAGLGPSSKIELYGIKKLRELILELAVRGLLVPQDPNDEPASELLKKIAVEKANLLKAGKINMERSLPPIIEEEKPFATPSGWAWVRIADIGYDFGQTTPNTKFTYIDVGAIDNRLGMIDSPTIISAEEAPSRARKLVKRGTVIYSTVRPYLLNIAIVQEDFDPYPIVSTAFAVVHPFENISCDYVYRYLRSPSFVSYVERVQTGIAYPAINDKLFFSGLIPLPPTAEQQRIVAKVDDLMALCDQLERQTDASRGVHQTLVETLLNSLTSTADHAQFAGAWQRIAEHFDTLFTTEESVAQLKQTILQLAVMGKLIPQDPNDEPASELLKKVSAEKTRLVKEGKIRNEKPLPPIGVGEKIFELPTKWAYCRLDAICTGITSGSTPPQSEFSENSEVPYLKVYNIRNQEIDFEYKPQFISKEYNSTKLKKSILYPGDVVMNIVGPPLGKVAIIPDSHPEWNCNQAIVFFRPAIPSLSKFIYVYLKTGLFLRNIELIGTAGQDNISVTKSRSIVLPLPPLNEQHYIAAKVDELMALCDQLKSRLSDAQATQLNLADALAEKALARAR